jgi:hypothetical protein
MREHPLDPLIFRSVIFNLIRGLSWGGCLGGRGASTMGWSPQERLIVSLRVSHENRNIQVKWENVHLLHRDECRCPKTERPRGGLSD